MDTTLGRITLATCATEPVGLLLVLLIGGPLSELVTVLGLLASMACIQPAPAAPSPAAGPWSAAARSTAAVPAAPALSPAPRTLPPDRRAGRPAATRRPTGTSWVRPPRRQEQPSRPAVLPAHWRVQWRMTASPGRPGPAGLGAAPSLFAPSRAPPRDHLERA